MKKKYIVSFIICNLVKKIIAAFIIFFGIVQNPVSADTWAGLKNTINSGTSPISVTLGGNIDAIIIPPSTVIYNTDISTNPATTIIDLGTHYISGSNNTSIFDNAGTLSLSNGTIKNAKAATTSGGVVYNTGTLNIMDVDFLNNQSATRTGGAISNLKNLTVTRGIFTGNSAFTAGGAIYNYLGVTANVTDSTFTGNSAGTGNGGAIYNLGTLTTTGGSFASNTAHYGGVIYNYIGTANITDSTFTGNSAGTGNGGAIYNLATLNLMGDSFVSNTAGSGGAIYNNNVGTLLTITGGTFTSNTADNGGAICNLLGQTTLSNVTFRNNSATSGEGGAISNNAGTLTIAGGSYDNNSAKNGGAIYNDGTVTLTGSSLSNVTFTNNSATEWGGAIMNYGTATLTDSTFSKNSAQYAGAIYNDVQTLSIIRGSFSENSATDWYGTIYNGGTLDLTDSTFSKNSAKYISAISNGSSGILTITGGSFFENTSTDWYGAIYNDGTANLTDTTFLKNTALGAGAIYNGSAGNLSMTGGSFSENSAQYWGGAIYNDGIANLTGTTFSKNSVANGGGGAIYNGSTGTLSITNGSFSENIATDWGGAIYNDGTATINDSTFTGNSATTSGGAIYNYGALNIKATVGNATTFNTTSDTIYLDSGTVNLDAVGTGRITFSGAIDSFSNSNAINVNSSPTSTGTINFNNNVTNSAINIFRGTANFGENISLANDKLAISGGTSNFINQNFNTSNDITFSGGTMNLNSGNGGSSYINDKIVGSGLSTMNINKTVGSNPTDGTVYVNNSITGGTNINLYNGTMALSNESYINGNNLGIDGGTINTQNGSIGTMALNTVAFLGNANWLMNVDLANVIGDKITSVNPATGSATLNISNINLLSDASAISTAIIVADTNTKNNVSTSVTSANGALFKYGVSYEGSGSNGVLNFVKSGISPNAVTSDVAQTQTFLLQTAIDRQFFGNVDGFMSFPLATRESTICCALAHDPTSGYAGGACPLSGNGTFSPIYSCDLNKGLWVKSFASFENIPLNNGPNVSTIEYGTLIGADAPLRYLGHGIVGNTSAYVGYLGANQNYDNVGVSQNGALVGLAENMVYKNTFLTLMASVGSSLGNAITPWGEDHFSSLFAGVAAKGGYNFEFKEGEYIIQPNLILAYTFTNTPDYTTASGINMSSKPLNAMQIAPGVRLIKNMKYEKGQVYLIAAYVQNIMDNTRFTANDVQLPQLSIAPYFEYGIGYQRVWKERFTGFAQTLLRGGGRNGVALQFGLRWAI